MNGTKRAGFEIAEAERRWTCLSCGDVYGSKFEELLDDIPPDNLSVDLSDNWTFPECGIRIGNFARTNSS